MNRDAVLRLSIAFNSPPSPPKPAGIFAFTELCLADGVAVGLGDLLYWRKNTHLLYVIHRHINAHRICGAIHTPI